MIINSGTRSIVKQKIKIHLQWTELNEEMLPATLLYNLVMIAVDIAAIQQFLKKKTFGRWMKILLLWGIVAAITAVLLGENGFGHMRLMSYGVFIHGPAILSASFLIFKYINRKAAIFCFLTAIVTCVSAVYAFFIEPHRLEETEFIIQNVRVALPRTIAVVSDLQTDHFGEYERQVLKRVMQRNPDLILLTGDYLQPSSHDQELFLHTTFNQFLRSIKFQAPYGVYAIRGDVDGETWKNIFQDLPIRTIEQTTSLDVGGMTITGLSRADSRKIDLQIKESPTFQIVFGHSPNFARGDIHAELLIAGHTHGGQIRFPLVGPLYIHSKVPRNWGAGMTRLDAQRTLIVSRGIGMERGFAPRLRFLCRPQLLFLTIRPSQQT